MQHFLCCFSHLHYNIHITSYLNFACSCKSFGVLFGNYFRKATNGISSSQKESRGGLVGLSVVKCLPLFLWYHSLAWTHNIQLFLALMSCEPTCPRRTVQCVTSVVWKRKEGWRIRGGEGERWDWYCQQWLARLPMKHMTQQPVQFPLQSCSLHRPVITSYCSKFNERILHST